MEETRKTARECVVSCDKLMDALSFFNPTAAKNVRKEIEDSMQQYAEQARREERERHKPLIDEVNNAIYRLSVRYGVYPVTVKLLKMALENAGYEGNEK